MDPSSKRITDVTDKYLQLADKVHMVLDEMKKFMTSKEFEDTVELIDHVAQMVPLSPSQEQALKAAEDSCMHACYQAYIRDLYDGWKN